MITFQFNEHKVGWDTTKPLLTKGTSSHKLIKSDLDGIYFTMGLHLAPSTMSGYNVCPKASKGCKKACLTFSGQGQMFTQGRIHESDLHVARTGRTVLLKKDRRLFFQKLKKELNSFVLRCGREGVLPAVRLNCTSDVAWENVKDPETKTSIIDLYPNIQFYDYTKIIVRLGNTPSNYDLTFSRSESNEEDVMQALAMGYNVAIPFSDGIPANYKGFRVFNGDDNDLRFEDNKRAGNNTGMGMVIALEPKGWKAKKDVSGFIVGDNSSIEYALRVAA